MALFTRAILPLVYCGLILLSAVQCTWAGEPIDLGFTSRLDGTVQHFVLMEPQALARVSRVPVLIALHGHGSDRWQFIRDGRDECRAARDAAAKWNMLYVSPDYRAKTSWMGPAAEADLLQILAELGAKYPLGKVVLCGGSMGGTAALTFAALHPDRVGGVVSMNGTANLVEYEGFQQAIAASFGGTKKDKPEEYRKRSAELHADRLTMPVACTTGGKDTLVPPTSVLRLYKSLESRKAPALLIHLPEGGHDTKYPDAARAFEFVLNRVVGEGPHP